MAEEKVHCPIHTYVLYYMYVTGFAKTVPNHTRTEIQFIA